MHFLEVIKLVLSVLPLLIDAIKTVESVFPESGKGREKLEMIRGIVQASYETSSKLAVSFDEIWQPIQKVISVIVGVFNTTGTFKK